MLIGGMTDADVARREINRRDAARGQERGFRPERRTLYPAAIGTDALDRLPQEAHGFEVRIDLGGPAANRVVAPGRIGEGDLNFGIGDCAPRRGLELAARDVEVLAGPELADEAELAL